MSQQSITSFNAAQFTKEGGDLKCNKVDAVAAKRGEIIVKVLACGLSQSLV